MKSSNLVKLVLQIVSDGWAAYNGIQNLQHLFNGVIAQKYAHDVVNHRFVIKSIKTNLVK